MVNIIDLHSIATSTKLTETLKIESNKTVAIVIKQSFERSFEEKEETDIKEVDSLLLDYNNNNNSNNYNYETISAKQFSNSIINNIDKYQTFKSQSREENIESSSSLAKEKAKIKNLLLVLLDWNNVRQTVNCFTKSRNTSKHARLQINLLFLILFTNVMVSFGCQTVMFQFTEQVYHWNAKTYTTLSSISSVMSNLLITLLTILLVKRWRFDDITLLMLALMSYFLSELILGTFLHSYAYFIYLVISSLNSFGTLAIRNRISKIVPQDEVGKIFSLCSTIEATLPFFGSIIYTTIFSASITTYPGLVFQFSAGIIALSFGLMVFEELYCNSDRYNNNNYNNSHS